MKKRIFLICAILMCSSLVIIANQLSQKNTDPSKRCHHDEPSTLSMDSLEEEKGCAFRTVFGEEPSQGQAHHKGDDHLNQSLQEGLKWISTAQLENGGWGAGSHSNQGERNPHSVAADPATTSMVCMALLRNGTTLDKGIYASILEKGTLFLLKEVEATPSNQPYITNEQGTQIQTKLGRNIDAVLTAQYFSNVLTDLDDAHKYYDRIKNALTVCVQKIEESIDESGRIKDAGWAGVLQSSFAANALESAKLNKVVINDSILLKAQKYQENNFDATSGDVKVSEGAGIMLYSVSGSARSSAKKAREVREKIKTAKKEGLISEEEEVSATILEKIGFTKEEANEANTSYQVYESSVEKSQQKDVIQGFGNDGGEEFLSFLQTGESLIINDDDSWKNWYDNTTGRLISIQNQDGSWNGHHCITSPVFCTSTCLLILSIDKDIEKLKAVGETVNN